MGIWVVILEAVATAEERRGLGVEPGALDDLTEELAGHYAVVTERPWAYETELWIEEGTAGGAILAAQFLWQNAVRYLGLPAWEVVRAEARDSLALEVGLIDWPDPPAGPDDEEPAEIGPAPPSRSEPAPAVAEPPRSPGAKKRGVKKAAAKKAATKKAAVKKAAVKKAASKKIATAKAAPKKVAAQGGPVKKRVVTKRARNPRP